MNNNFLHVRSPLVDLTNTHIAVNALNREVAHIAVAAQGLDGGAANFFSHFTRKQLGHGSLLEARQARIAQACGMPDQLPGSFNFCRALGQPKADCLMVDDGDTKTLALFGIVTCHMADGLGVDGMNPPLVKTDYVLGDKTRLTNVLLNGLKGVEIGGEQYHGVMPAQATLTDVQIAAVLTYVRNAFGNKASAVSVAEVKAVRAGKK